MGEHSRAIAGRLAALKVVPVLRLPSQERAAGAIDCLIEAGYETVEITLTTPGALALIRSLRASVAADFLIGAGTVLDAQSAHACLDAGADYLVSPALIPELVPMAHALDRAALMGGFTPGEVLAAWHSGADAVKLFPASSGGPAHLAAIHAVYPEIPLCPTGGISTANLLDYLQAGARFVGVGNSVIDQQALVAGDRAQVIRHARSFLELAGTRT
jgi:2-dehydro-3-deoxyphosphogluconate aldolase / (4S)-4-hydroxy-2-oxoglutarate aldolase